MGRKFIDCREIPRKTKWSVAISADSEEELLEAAVQRAVRVHEIRQSCGSKSRQPSRSEPSPQRCRRVRPDNACAGQP